MEVNYIKSFQSSSGADNKQEKQKWVEDNARRLQHLFEQWQKPLGINGNQYQKYLKDELHNYCDEPLLRSLIDSIT
ncbi:MAG: hypothetical protein ACYSSP_06785 [Planctomycetota bacterium]|jgi:predicted DNA-binding protein YlxM (UPF0122 family)